MPVTATDPSYNEAKLRSLMLSEKRWERLRANCYERLLQVDRLLAIDKSLEAREILREVVLVLRPIKTS